MGVYPSEPAEYSGVTVYAPTAFTQGVTVYPAAANPIPPVPDLTDFIGIYSQNGIGATFQDGSALIQAIGDTTDVPVPSTAAVPYPLDWTAIAGAGANPKVFTWFDQSPATTLGNVEGTNRPAIDVGGESFDWVAADTPDVSTGDLPGSITALTIFIAVDMASWDANQALLMLRPDVAFAAAGNAQFCIFTDNTTDGRLFVGQSDAADNTNTQRYDFPAPTSGKAIVTAIFDRTAAAANQTKMYFNGVSVGVAVTLSDMASSEFEVRPVGLGWGNTGVGTQYFDGSMSNVWIATGAFNDNRRQEVEAFIAAITGTSL